MSLNGTIQSVQTAVITENDGSGGTATTIVDRLSISGNTNILANGEFEWTGFSTLDGAQLQVQDLDFVGNENMKVHLCK
jgi:hypothetical protein